MIIGRETVYPGINITFEAAIKDEIKPHGYFLKEDSTDIHLEVLINWNKNAPEGSPEGGFIPCLLYTSPSPRDRVLSRMPSSA